MNYSTLSQPGFKAFVQQLCFLDEAVGGLGLERRAGECRSEARLLLLLLLLLLPQCVGKGQGLEKRGD